MTFEEYLVKKNIDRTAFLASRPALFHEWEKLFSQVSPDSFTVQKKFLINDVRRQFLLAANS